MMMQDVLLPCLTSEIPYQRVCGKVIGYQEGTTDAFNNFRSHSIEGAYVDGVILTHGHNICC